MEKICVSVEYFCRGSRSVSLIAKRFDLHAVDALKQKTGKKYGYDLG